MHWKCTEGRDLFFNLFSIPCFVHNILKSPSRVPYAWKIHIQSREEKSVSHYKLLETCFISVLCNFFICMHIGWKITMKKPELYCTHRYRANYKDRWKFSWYFKFPNKNILELNTSETYFLIAGLKMKLPHRKENWMKIWMKI